MNIVFAGDFSQLEPVKGEPLYSCLDFIQWHEWVNCWSYTKNWPYVMRITSLMGLFLRKPLELNPEKYGMSALLEAMLRRFRCKVLNLWIIQSIFEYLKKEINIQVLLSNKSRHYTPITSINREVLDFSIPAGEEHQLVISHQPLHRRYCANCAKFILT